MSEPGVERLLADHTPPIRTITARLRELILKTVPEAEERLYTGWHALGYVHPVAGLFGGIFPRVEAVKLCFEWGGAPAGP